MKIIDILLKSFLLEYISCAGGIHCDNSKWAYILHRLDQPHHLSPLTPSHPLKAIATSFFIPFHTGV
jgi:hypothetical protein